MNFYPMALAHDDRKASVSFSIIRREDRRKVWGYDKGNQYF